MSTAKDDSAQTALDHTGSKLYEGEVLADIEEHPCIYQYLPPASNEDASPPNPPTPLMVFIPGAAHLARMAYGVPSHSSHDPSDFLAYHLNALGYPFLGISYPIESADPDSHVQSQTENNPAPSLMPVTSYDFRITDWGRQAVEVTARVISQHQLSNDVVLIVWSMGGRMVVPYTEHAKSLGLNVRTLFPLAASPGLQTANPPVKNAKASKNGYAKVGMEYEKPFLQMIHTQQDHFENGRKVLPDAIWRRDYFGYCPVALMGWKLRSDRSDDKIHGTSFKFVEDEWQGFIDSDTSNVANLPNWIASIYSDSKMDAKHGLTDRAVWGSLLSQKILSRVEGLLRPLPKDGKTLSDERWQRLMRIVEGLPERLSVKMAGTHFFFLGRTGAHNTAVMIDRLLGVTDQLDQEIKDILEEGT